MDKFITKDSGKRQEYSSGMKRDLQVDKARFDLLVPEFLNYNQTMLYRWAMLLYRGAIKYGVRNWEKANTQEEMDRFKASAFRHFMQWFSNANDGEDHAAAIFFNVNCYESIKEKMGGISCQQKKNKSQL